MAISWSLPGAGSQFGFQGIVLLLPRFTQVPVGTEDLDRGGGIGRRVDGGGVGVERHVDVAALGRVGVSRVVGVAEPPGCPVSGVGPDPETRGRPVERRRGGVPGGVGAGLSRELCADQLLEIGGSQVVGATVVGAAVVGAAVVGGTVGAAVVGGTVVGVAVVVGFTVVVVFDGARRRASAVTPSAPTTSSPDGAAEQLASTPPSRKVVHRIAKDRAVREGAIGFRPHQVTESPAASVH